MENSIKTAFTVRKSSRLVGRKNKPTKGINIETQNFNDTESPDILNEGGKADDSNNFIADLKQMLRKSEEKQGMMKTRKSDKQHPSEIRNREKTPERTAPLKSHQNESCAQSITPSISISSPSSPRREAFETADRIRSSLLSPTKRKSDNENENAYCRISPLKTPRASRGDKFLRAPYYGTPSTPSALKSPETPKSSKLAPLEFRSTPRRLFGSPDKKPKDCLLTKALGQIPNSILTPEKSPSTKLKPMQLYKPNAIIYQSAKQCLHTAKPDHLIGRDVEEAEIQAFISDKLEKKNSGSLYISGAPGTGKTAVVNHVLNKMKIEHKDLKTAFINCMMLKDSNAVFRQLHEQLVGVPIKAKDSMKAMEKLFMSCLEPILLVLDEIDQLDNKHHHILYQIFEWPAIENSKLILIGIANALDLTDRVLPRLQASTVCRPVLMNFPPYSSTQISDILKHRLQDSEIIEPSAITFCARKVSAVAGDMRKALDVCRRAVEMVESDVRCQHVLKTADCNSPTKRNQPARVKKVTIAHISQIMSDVYGSSVTAANSSENGVPLQQKLAVCSLLVLVKNGKVKEVALGKLHEVYVKVCRRQQMAPVDQSEFHSVLSLLDARGVVTLKKAKDTRMTKVSLKLDEQELEQTLKDKALMASIISDGVPK